MVRDGAGGMALLVKDSLTWWKKGTNSHKLSSDLGVPWHMSKIYINSMIKI